MKKLNNYIMLLDDGNRINPDEEYCDRCGEPVDINKIQYILTVPLCKDCWIEKIRDESDAKL